MNPTETKQVVPKRVAEINTEIARQGNKGFSVAPSAPTYVPPTTISSDSLAPVTPINIPPVTPPSTNTAGFSSEVSTKITNDYNTLQNELKAREAEAQRKASESKSSLLQQIGLKSQAVEDKATAMQTPEFLAKQKAVNDAYSQVQQLDQAQRAEIEALNTQGLTAQGSQIAQAGIQRKYALARANLAVTYDVANRDYQSAIENIDRTASLKMEAVQPMIDFYSKILETDLSQFSKAEQNTLQVRLSEFEKKQKDISAVGDILKTAITNGVQLSPQDVSKINSFTNPNDAMGYLASKGISLQDPMERQIKQAQLNKLNLEASKIIQDSITTAPAQKQVTETTNTINDINNILSNEAFDNTFGVTNIIQRNIAGTSSYGLNAQINNLTNKLALAARGQLKGQGAVSDFEGKMLKEAQTALKINMSPEQARKELAKVRGALATTSGLNALVKITNPKTGESQNVEVSQAGIEQAIKDGLQVEYQ